MKDWKWILFILLLLYAVASTLQCNQNRREADNALPAIDDLKKQAEQASDSALFYKRKASSLMIEKANADSIIKVKEKALTEIKRVSQVEIDRIKLQSTDEAITDLRKELQDSLHPFKLKINDESLVAITESQTKKFRLTLAELPACSLQVKGLEDLLSSKDMSLAVGDSIIDTQKQIIAFEEFVIDAKTTEAMIWQNRVKEQDRKVHLLKVERILLGAAILIGAGLYIAK